MKSDKEIFEQIYEEKAVWTETEPPLELLNLINSGKIAPCRVLDAGCGAGFYSIYMAKKGFDVTGIDISENAIRTAKENAIKHKVKIEFIPMDISDLDKLKVKFDFIFEWALLHHIAPEIRKKYIIKLKSILNSGGKYLSVCFNNQNSDFGLKGKKLRTVPEGGRMPAGTRLYYSSFTEINNLLKPHFKTIEARLIKMTAGNKVHIGNYYLSEKR